MKHGMAEQPQQEQQVQQKQQDGCVGVNLAESEVALVEDDHTQQPTPPTGSPLEQDGLTNFDVLLTRLDPYTLAKMTVKLICVNGIEHYYCTTPGQLFPMTSDGLDNAVAYEKAYWESIAPTQDQPS